MSLPGCAALVTSTSLLQALSSRLFSTTLAMSQAGATCERWKCAERTLEYVVWCYNADDAALGGEEPDANEDYLLQYQAIVICVDQSKSSSLV